MVMKCVGVASVTEYSISDEFRHMVSHREQQNVGVWNEESH